MVSELKSVAMEDCSTGVPVEPGVYCLYCDRNDSYYVGSSQNMRMRFRGHRESLRKKKHHNVRVIASCLKYGIGSFLFRPIEICEKDKLGEREEHWITALDSSGSHGLNVFKNSRGNPGAPTLKLKEACRRAALSSKKKKHYEFLSPDGAIHQGIGISDFCRNHGLDAGSMGAVLAGKLVSSSGWTKTNARIRLQSNVRHYSVIAPDGTHYTGTNRWKFSREHGLERQRFSRLCSGKLSLYKGWRTAPCS